MWLIYNQFVTHERKKYIQRVLTVVAPLFVIMKSLVQVRDKL
jgi:hypothetical protein